MNSFTLTKRAKADLKAIAKFTEKHWGRTQRNLYVRQFDEAFHMLAETPSIGKSCDFIKENYHRFPQGSHIIFFKVTSDGINVIRILHKNMDIASKFGGS